MAFKALYFEEKLTILNPAGDVGVVTLWSPVAQILSRLARAEIDLTPERSRIAALGTLYGNGFPQLLRNLLYNPQIRHLVIVGRNRFQSREAVIGFFTRGLEEVEIHGARRLRVVGCGRLVDGLVTPEDFAGGITLYDLGELHAAEGVDSLRACFRGLPPPEPCHRERREIPIQELSVGWLPSEPASHVIHRRTPLEAWRELVFRLYRFGVEIRLKKGLRRELQHVKVVVTEAAAEPRERLAAAGFDLDEIRRYQREILTPDLAEGDTYSYGNRLRGYFLMGATRDALEHCIVQLQSDPESRNAYVTLWDNSRDLLPGSRGHPCLVSLFFRRFQGKLTLGATFRSHNGLDAWLNNVYGLMAIRDHVAAALSLDGGAITVISHSLTLDPAGGGLDRARDIALARHGDDDLDADGVSHALRLDPNGHFLVSSDPGKGEIVVQHQTAEGELLAEYRGRTALALERQLARDQAVSLISHALYLGREIARQEFALRHLSHEEPS